MVCACGCSWAGALPVLLQPPTPMGVQWHSHSLVTGLPCWKAREGGEWQSGRGELRLCMSSHFFSHMCAAPLSPRGLGGALLPAHRP